MFWNSYSSVRTCSTMTIKVIEQVTLYLYVPSKMSFQIQKLSGFHQTVSVHTYTRNVLFGFCIVVKYRVHWIQVLFCTRLLKYQNNCSMHYFFNSHNKYKGCCSCILFSSFFIEHMAVWAARCIHTTLKLPLGVTLGFLRFF